jgi:putative transposase
VYNWALRLRTDSYRAGKTISYCVSSSALTKLKETTDHAWLNEVSCVPTQQALRHLQTAYRNFFDKRSAYPSFKKKRDRQAAEYTKSAFKWDADSRTLAVAQLGKLKIRWSRTFASAPSTVTITKDAAGRYFVTLVLDEKIAKFPKTGAVVGIDLGISRLATLSTGERIPNPQHLRAEQRRLVRAQRVLARRVKGSGRRERARLRVAKIQAHIADARTDYLHKVTTDIVRRFDVICLEDLNVRGMVRNHSLARSLSDSALSRFRRFVEYKCEWYGKERKLVDRFFPSSKRCHDCGHIVESLPLSVREWDCPECQAHHDRDANAALNILTAGHAVTARGGRGSRARGTLRTRSVRRTVNQPGECSSHLSSGIRLL